MKILTSFAVFAVLLSISGCDVSPKEAKKKLVDSVYEFLNIKRPEKLDNWIYFSMKEDVNMVVVMNAKPIPGVKGAELSNPENLEFALILMGDHKQTFISIALGDKASCGRGNTAFVTLSGIRTMDIKAINTDGSCTMALEPLNDVIKLMTDSSFVRLKTKVGPYEFDYLLSNTSTAISRFRKMVDELPKPK